MIKFETFLTTQDEKTKSEFIKQILSSPENYLDGLLQVNKNCAHALSVLTKKNLVVKMLKDKIEGLLKEYFNSTDAKIRKYAYIIAGNLNTSYAQQLLDKSVENENTYYTLPSLMLALGSQKDSAKKLMDKVDAEKQNIAPKIYNQIFSAYQKVCPPTVFKCTNILVEKEDFLITTQKSYEDILCKFLPYKKEKTKRGIVCKNLDLSGFINLSERRDIYSVLLIVGTYENEKTATENALLKLQSLVKTNQLPIGYRISCNDNKLIEKLVSACKNFNCDSLKNSPSNYSVTLEFYTEKQITAYIKFECFKPNFDYRTEFLPASINPVTASVIAQIAQNYNPNAKTVCDPFCGTATMLAERFYTNENVKIVGSDISVEAIKKAKINLANAKIKGELVVKNVSAFNTPCDEIISNLPYGLRVGTHQGNHTIYQALINACQNYLKVGGHAFLYTADKKILRDLIKHSKLSLVNEMPLISGGLYCTLFIIKK